MTYEEKVRFKELNKVRFCQYMKLKSEELGISKKTFFNDPCGGRANTTTARDSMRWFIKGYETKALRPIWSLKEHTIRVKGENPRKISLVSTVTGAPESHILTDHYEVLGGKTGTLGGNIKTYNISFIARAEGIDDLFVCVILQADEKNALPKNRFQAAKEAMDIAVKKYRDRSFDTLKEDVCADSVIVALLPKKNGNGRLHRDLDVLYEKNADDIKHPASTTKVMTAIIGLELIEDLDKEIQIEQEDYDAIPPKFSLDIIMPGDIISLRDLLYAMMLPSNNEASFYFASYITEKYFR